MHTWILALGLLSACSTDKAAAEDTSSDADTDTDSDTASDTATDTDTDTDADTDADTDTDTDTDLPDDLNGEVIDPPVPPPDFSATNMDGSTRGAADLMDGPTVIWFYPAPDTPG